MQYIFIFSILFHFFFLPNLYHLQTLDSPTSSDFDWKAFLNLSPEHSRNILERRPAQSGAIDKHINHESNQTEDLKREKKRGQKRKYRENEKIRFNALSQEEKDAKRQRKNEIQKAYNSRNKVKFGYPTKRVARMKGIRLLEKDNKASDEQLEILRKEKQYQREYYLKKKAKTLNEP